MLFSKVYAIAVAGLAFVDGAVAQNKYPLTGVQTGIVGNLRPARKDIRDLFNDKIAFSLFIQGLNAVMAVNETTLTSYFGVGGIHGRPFAAWDGVNPQEMLVDGIPIGYCPHGNILFGMWHRPYLLLLEQLIAEKAQAIARSYNSQQWVRAANTLRLPYWDWALPPVSWPLNILSVVNITITTPSGQRTVANPLYRYRFKGQPYSNDVFPQDSYLGTQQYTLRSPNTQTNTSNDASAAEEIGYSGPGLTRAVWDVFAKQTDFNGMTTWNPNPNFEGVHGTVHIVTGGHMAPADYTGFDPLFFLHHAAVDRQIALWQAINPNSWMVRAVSPGGSWTIYPNTLVDDNTRLAPFTRGDRTTPHTSNSVRNIADLGYSYADIPSHILSGAALSANVTARVNQIYNPSGTFTKRALSYTPRRNAKAVIKRDGSLTEWTVNVKVPNGATGQGFAVHFELNKVPVGQVSILSAPSAMEIAIGVKKFGYGEFSLSAGLEGATDVGASIRKGLWWDVVNADGTTVPLDGVEGLEIVIAEQSVVPAEDETTFPKFGEKVYHPEILA